MKTEIGSCQGIVAGVSEGLALVSSQPFSLWGDLDPQTGKIINPRSSLFGESVKGRVLVYPRGRGSSTTSACLLEAIRCSSAPCAIINMHVEPILVVGVLVAQEIYDRIVPIAAVSEDVFRLLRTGDYLLVDSVAGKLYRKS
jgi:predicted aconitase with swiveling domain